MESIIALISIIGSYSLGISGALTAMNERFDPFGILIIAFVTAVGGGTLRDVLLSTKEVFWLVDPTYLYYTLGGAVTAVLFRKYLVYFQRSLLFFDAAGLGLFTVTGVQIGLTYGLPAINCIILGTITGSFGGVIRDILVNRVPVIFMKEVYATVSVLGGLLYYLLFKVGLPNPYLQLIPILFILISRLLIVRFKISLPSLYRD
jgi:uncharacterized membrane protein YeiH